MVSLAYLTAASLGVLLPSTIFAASHLSLPLPDTLDRSAPDDAILDDTKGYTAPRWYQGDVLNVTKCFCEDQHSLSPPKQRSDGPAYVQKPSWGHYFQFDYYNWHLKTLYTLSETCDSRIQINDHKMMLPTCWEERLARKDCGTFADGNIFCYQVGILGKWSDQQMEHYRFNRQKRGLPKNPKDMVPDLCEGFCRDKVFGMAVARDSEGVYVKTWKKDGGEGVEKNISSTFVSYVDTDDMCAGCS